MSDSTASGAGWSIDPSRRHRLRYRDRQWTAWVADADGPELDPEGLLVVRRKRRRQTALVATVIAVCLLAGLGMLQLIAQGSDDLATQEQTQVRSDRAALAAEWRAWTLPATMVAVPRLDEDLSDLPFADVTHHYAAVSGSTTEQAVDDLVRYLSTRGWEFGADPRHPWTADNARMNASLAITVEAGIITVDMSS